MGLGETLANFFSFIFPVSWISRGKTNYQIFLLISILIFCSLCWWFAKKIFVIFFGGTGHEPKIDVSFGFWSFDFGGLDFGVLILGVRILEFWFWGFGSWSFDFGFWSFDLGVFGLLISFVSFWKVLWVWSGFLGKVLEEMLVRVWGETIADADTIVGKCSWVCSGSRFYLCSVVWGHIKGSEVVSLGGWWEIWLGESERNHCRPSTQRNCCKDWILEFGSWILDTGVLILDLGILILGVWILEFWFWGFGFWSFDFRFWILDFDGFWGFGFGFVSMIPPTTKETRFLDLFVCTLVGRPWCWPHMSCGCDGPGADQRHIGRQSNLGNE